VIDRARQGETDVQVIVLHCDAGFDLGSQIWAQKKRAISPNVID